MCRYKNCIKTKRVFVASQKDSFLDITFYFTINDIQIARFNQLESYSQPANACEIYSKLTIKTSERRHSKSTIKTPERRQWRRSDVFIVNFEHISHLVLVFLVLTLSR